MKSKFLRNLALIILHYFPTSKLHTNKYLKHINLLFTFNNIYTSLERNALLFQINVEAKTKNKNLILYEFHNQQYSQL